MKLILYPILLGVCLSMVGASLFEGNPEDVLVFNTMKQNFKGIIVGCADINNDRRNDFFVLNGKVLNIVYQLDKNGALYEERKLLDLGDKAVKSLVTSDFNGDSVIDILLLSTGSGNNYKATVYFGSSDGSTTKFDDSVDIGTFSKHPLLLQWDMDMLTDILAETQPGQLSIFKFDSNKKLKIENVTKSFPHLATPAYSAFVDVTGNLQADILLSVTESSKQKFVIVSRVEGEFDFSKPKSLPVLPENYAKIGQPLFQDWDFDGRLEMLLPVCSDDTCATSELFIFDFVKNKWEKASVDLQDWRFLPADNNKVKDDVDLSQLSVITMADINLDQYPDCLLVMKNSKTSKTSAAVLLNQGSKKFKLNAIKTGDDEPQIAAFVEFGETGVFDIVTVSKGDKTASTTLHRQNTIGDAYFLKVMILSGLCGESSQCPSSRLPLGIPTPGPSMHYTTEAPQGGQVSSCAAQVTHTSYMALGLPFYVFGLGPFANYLEKLQVSLPSKSVTGREHEFNFIVPKTELTIIPYPLDSPSKWKSKLFIDPFTDKKVIYVAVALCGVCLIVLAIIIVLQYLEIRADRIEKMQEAQKFNFDAM